MLGKNYLCTMQLILNDIGTGEVILILLFALMFFGSKSIPGLARSAGRTMRQIKDASSEIQNEIKKSGSEMKSDLNLKGILEETAEDIKRPLDQYAEDIDHAVKYQPPRRPATRGPLGHEQREEPSTQQEAPTPLDQASVDEDSKGSNASE